MNKALKKILHKLFLNRFSWKIFQPLVYAGERLKAAKKFDDDASEKERLNKIALERIKGSTVRHGPFKGMNYHEMLPTGSSYFAKLLGSYEAEIHPFLDEVMKKNYDVVVNVGCDEGYYAVGLGLALKCPVIVFDLNNKALEQCNRLAEKNGIASRFVLKGKCTAEDLVQINYGRSGLLIIDCEGDEVNIFNEIVAARLSNSDLIIELHLHEEPEIVDYLTALFDKTHEIRVVNSVDDHLKVMQYVYPELDGLSYAEKKFILEEREVFMQWMYLTRRQ